MRQLLINFVKCYQICLSSLMPPSCRFYPTCSNYAQEALAKHGVLSGLWLSIKRILRCHHWNPGGHDPVP